MMCCSFCCFFFFKQKTAYEMRISDWSSDVCSSDLCNVGKQERPFDMLRANGVEIQPLARISRAAAAIESRLGSVSVAALPSGMKLSWAAMRARDRKSVV